MAVSRSSAPNRFRNVFFLGVAIGLVVAVIANLLLPNGDVSKKDITAITDRLSAIEAKLATPTPAPAASASPQAAVSVAAINAKPNDFTDKVVDVTGKVNSPHQGVGFILVDSDGSFLWVHSKDKIPTGAVTVHGKVSKLTDQLSQWKNEPGWPEDDSALTAKLKNEKIYIETVGVQ